MPYFFDPNLQRDDDGNQTGYQISGASPTTDSAGNTQGQDSKHTNTGSGFQNLDKYLQNNQPQQFGQQVVGKVQNEVNQAQQSMEDAGNQFKEQVQTANRLPTQEDISQAIAQPEKADKKEFQSWQNQTYTGPKSLAESQDTWNRYWSGVNKANTSSQLLGNEAGRFTLLDSYFGRPGYSYGEKSLDNLLVQQSGLGDQTKALQNQATQLNAQGNQGLGQLNDAASQRAGEVEQSRQGVRKAIGLDDQGKVITGDNAGAIGQQYKAVQDAVAAQNAQRQADVNSLQAHLGTGVLNRDDLYKLGLDQGQNYYNLDLNNYLTQGADLNVNQVMTPEQRARIQALSELAGITDTFASGDAQDINPAYQFNKNQFLEDVGSAQAQYQTKANDLAARIQTAERDLMKAPGRYNRTPPRTKLNQLLAEKAALDAEYGINNRIVRSEVAPVTRQSPYSRG